MPLYYYYYYSWKEIIISEWNKCSIFFYLFIYVFGLLHFWNLQVWCKNNQSKAEEKGSWVSGILIVRSQIIPIHVINTIFSGIQESKSQEKLLILWYNYVVFIEWSNKQTFASLEKKEFLGSIFFVLAFMNIYFLYFALNYSVTLHL